jgi:hypothetical protein
VVRRERRQPYFKLSAWRFVEPLINHIAYTVAARLKRADCVATARSGTVRAAEKVPRGEA